MVKIGNPRNASGAPIDKTIEVSIPFCCKILGAINKSINTFDSHGPVVIAAGPNGQVAATMYTTLRFWLEKKDDTKRRAGLQMTVGCFGTIDARSNVFQLTDTNKS